jgi:hypothetical protein
MVPYKKEHQDNLLSVWKVFDVNLSCDGKVALQKISFEKWRIITKENQKIITLIYKTY